MYGYQILKNFAAAIFISFPHVFFFSVLNLDFESEDVAQTVCRVVSVDKEPSRSNAVRSFRVEGPHLLMLVPFSHLSIPISFIFYSYLNYSLNLTYTTATLASSIHLVV